MPATAGKKWHTGRIFTVEAEQIVGISWAWPIAVTVETGELHTVKRDPRLWTVAPKGGLEEPEIAGAVKEAIELAQSKGWDIAGAYDLDHVRGLAITGR